MTKESQSNGLARAATLTTLSSLTIPLVGLLTQPILAQGLGVQGRGLLAAALAPSALVVAVATIGLPEALTYTLAKKPTLIRPAALRAALFSLIAALACLGATYIFLPFLSDGNATLGTYMLLATSCAAPALIVGTMRGAASGLQQWTRVACERVISTMCRLLFIVALWFTDHLTVLGAVIVTVVAPLIGAVVYFPLLRQRTSKKPSGGGLSAKLLSFGSRIWVGAVAEMFLGRVGQLLLGPLASIEDLGLYSIATTIADVPLIAALAVQSATFGVSSKKPQADVLCSASRFTVLAGTLICVALGSTLPLWIGPVFGSGFEYAVAPTLLCILSALICVPGLLAAGGIAAWGRPGLRSLGLALTLAVYLIAFVAVTPFYGVLGASLVSVLANLTMTIFMTIAAGRLLDVNPISFYAITFKDLLAAYELACKVSTRTRRRS